MAHVANVQEGQVWRLASGRNAGRLVTVAHVDRWGGPVGKWRVLADAVHHGPSLWSDLSFFVSNYRRSA